MPLGRLPSEIQELIDEVVAALGTAVMLDRHPAYDQLTSWLELDDRLNDDVYCGGGWVRALHESELKEGVIRDLQGLDLTPPERIARMRQVLELGLAGVERYFGDEREVHTIVRVRARDGKEAVLACLYHGANFETRVTWEGLFQDEAAYRRSLRQERMLTSVQEFDALSFDEQLALWWDDDAFSITDPEDDSEE